MAFKWVINAIIKDINEIKVKNNKEWLISKFIFIVKI